MSQAQVIYDYLVDLIGDQWDTYKYDGQEFLANTGIDGKGVFKDFPLVLNDLPAIGVLLGTENYEDADNDNGLTQALNFRLLLHCYRADTPDAMDAILRMRDVVLKIIMSDRSLGGSAHKVSPVSCTYGVLSDATFMPGEIKIVGCDMSVRAEIFAEQII